MFLVVVEPAGAARIVPYLHLRIAAEIDAAVAFFADLPIHIKLKIAVVFCRLQALAFAVVVQNAVFHSPVRQVFLVGLFLLGRQLLGS